MSEARQRKSGRRPDQGQTFSHSDQVKQQSSSFTCRKLLYFLAGFVILEIVILGLVSSPIDPEAFELPAPRPWTGPLAENTRLREGRRILENRISGPESLTYRDGRLYAGTLNGNIVEITNDNDTRVIATLGGPGCGDHHGDEKSCGRPLGIRFIDDELYVIDAFLGLYHLDLKGGKPTQLVSTQTKYDGHTMKFANDFEKLDDGQFIMSDTSHKWHMTQYGLLALENRPNGRLILYDPDTKTSEVAYSGLYSPNGIQLSPNKDFLLIAESTRYRVLKYHTKGPKKGTTEVFVDNLPGMPDNISPSHGGGYWIAFALANSRMGPFKMDLVAPRPWIRNTVAKIVDPTPLVEYMPQYGLIMEVSQEGEILQSLHDPWGKVVPSVSEVLDTGDALYLGSYHAPFIVKLDLK